MQNQLPSLLLSANPVPKPLTTVQGTRVIALNYESRGEQSKINIIHLFFFSLSFFFSGLSQRPGKHWAACDTIRRAHEPIITLLSPRQQSLMINMLLILQFAFKAAASPIEPN